MVALNLNVSENFIPEVTETSLSEAVSVNQTHLPEITPEGVLLSHIKENLFHRFTAKAEENDNPVIRRAARIIRSMVIISSAQEKENLLTSLCNTRKPTVVSFVNAHGFNIAWENEEFAANIYRSDVVLRDGVGVSVLLKALGIPVGLNMNGTDFIPEIAARFAGKRVAICGTTEPYLARAAEKLHAMGCTVVLVVNGFTDAEVYAEHVARCEPDLVILGMGMPKQEAVSMLIARTVTKPMLIVNGGAILDFWAERFRRAPYIWQLLRMEWLFRLLNEPRRLWKRYILGGGQFFTRLVHLRLSDEFI